MTLPLIESLGSHLVFYFAVLVNASNADEGTCRHFFSINTSSYFHPGSDTREWYIMPRSVCS